jgi:hypothetical protein
MSGDFQEIQKETSMRSIMRRKYKVQCILLSFEGHIRYKSTNRTGANVRVETDRFNHCSLLYES